jgi:hypothetical protein
MGGPVQIFWHEFGISVQKEDNNPMPCPDSQLQSDMDLVCKELISTVDR